MDNATTKLCGAGSLLLQQLAHFGVRSTGDATPIDISSLEAETVDALFRTPLRTNTNPQLASLLSESRTCLQLIAGFLGAVRKLPSMPAVVRFEVPGHGGNAIPVTMPAASAVAMTQDAKRLASALKKHERTRAR
jgi:hypothetical protein